MKKKNVKNNANNNNAVQKGIKKFKIKDNNKKEKKPIKNSNNKKNNNKIIIKKNYNPPQKNKKYIKKLNIRNLKIPNEFGSSTSLDAINKTKSISKKNPIKNLNINIIPINKLLYSNSKKSKKLKNKKPIISKSGVNLINLKKKKNNTKNTDLKNAKKVLDIDYINYQMLNIQELNILEYKVAILVDKRTYLQYYCSLIRKKQLIIFTFVPNDDYNLVSIKIASFLLQLSLYICVNAFFFTDNTMHQIYTDNGELNLGFHLLHIIYSSLISTVINTILRQLSLSENNILEIKKIKLLGASIKKSKTIRNFLRIKIILFFIISFILTFFIWYFIACFCAVYPNTQIILVKESLISFGLSMFYPFWINLIPGIFRIPALRTKNKECIYKISQLLSLI
jgi:hypothetical protein